jgi:FAD:protein FMN transferase
MEIVRLARHAMATRFEFVLCGDDPVRLRAAGEEALDEIERLEAQLSLFRPTSEIAHLNARAAREPVRVTPTLFSLLEHARRLYLETQGAFDITIAPLGKCWGFMGGSGHVPRAQDLAAARSVVGMNLVHLDPDRRTIQFEREGVMLDLGAIGKGYALECAVEFLTEAGVASALIHGGTSTIHALGHPPEAEAWKIEIPDPANQESVRLDHNSADERGKIPFATVSLNNKSVSVSAVWGKSFQSEGKLLGHILDPRTGEPAGQAVMSAVVLESATETDALSTALLTLGPVHHDLIANLRPGIETLVVAQTEQGWDIKSRGITVAPRS